MKLISKTLLIIVISITICSCNFQKLYNFKPKEVYKSKDLTVTQISENSFERISFKQKNDFGNVPCNGLIFRNSN